MRPRIRTIKPELWQSRDFMTLPVVGKLAFFCLISHADDEGRLKTDHQHASDAWMHLPADQVKTGFDALANRRMIAVYRIAGEPFIQIEHWHDHQKVDHPNPSRYPPPPLAKRRERSRKLANIRDSDPPTVSDRTGPDRKASSNEDARKARLFELRTQVCRLWAAHHGWPDGKWLEGRRDDAQLITVWVRDKGYPLELWQEAIAQVPIGATFRWLVTPPAEGRVCRLEEWAIARKDREYAALKAQEARPTADFTGLVKRIA